MRTSKIIKNLKENSLLFKIVSLFAETQCFTSKRCQRLSESKVQPFQKAGADIEPQFGKPFRSASDAMSDTDQSAFFLLFYYLSIYEIGMRLFHREPGAPWFSGSWKNLELMVVLKQCIVITAKAITEITRYPHYNTGSQCNQRKGCFRSPWPHNDSQNKSKFRCITNPNPLLPLFCFRAVAFSRISIFFLTIIRFSPDKALHFIQFYSGHRKLFEKNLVDFIRFFERSIQPGQNSVFFDIEYEGAPTGTYFYQ